MKFIYVIIFLLDIIIISDQIDSLEYLVLVSKRNLFRHSVLEMAANRAIKRILRMTYCDHYFYIFSTRCKILFEAPFDRFYWKADIFMYCMS